MIERAGIYGYDNVDKGLVINEKESKIVEEIFLLRELSIGATKRSLMY